ncbi:MAG: divergent polysaccharide deacetylase family protein [Spirochaetaceae bacterium]|nr:divergent polysaccharide deacetylase family protein [Spirochaetaceae bacterium]
MRTTFQAAIIAAVVILSSFTGYGIYRKISAETQMQRAEMPVRIDPGKEAAVFSSSIVPEVSKQPEDSSDRTAPVDALSLAPAASRKSSPARSGKTALPSKKVPAASNGTNVPRALPPAIERRPAVPAPAELRLPETPVQGHTLIFMIDDAGNNLAELEPFLNYPGSLTIAVLPGLPNSAETARRIRAAGKELFLHQPMEAEGGEDPGPGALYTGMTKEDVRRVLEKNLAEVGPVAGINNHQGSRATADAELMETVLTVCREHGLLFLDSRTTAKTVVPAVARRLAMPFAARDIFLDNNRERQAIIGSLNEGLAKSAYQSPVVMIGHAWSKELAPLLEEVFPALRAHGYVFSGVVPGR